MTETSLFQVLQFVRSIRDGRAANRFGDDNAMIDVLRGLWDVPAEAPEFMRALASMQERVCWAIDVVTTDERIDGEGKDGLLTTLGQINQSLSPASMHTALRQFYPNLSITISQISLVAGLSGLTGSPFAAARGEIDELLSELEAELERLSTEEFSDIREFARKQIAALIMFLKNVEVFGAESAYTAYFQLALSVRRARESNSESNRAVSERLWPAVERWAGRLAIIEAAVTHSQSLIAAGRQAILLLGGPS